MHHRNYENLYYCNYENLYSKICKLHWHGLEWHAVHFKLIQPVHLKVIWVVHLLRSYHTLAATSEVSADSVWKRQSHTRHLRCIHQR
jgi:hypothetical protein